MTCFLSMHRIIIRQRILFLFLLSILSFLRRRWREEERERNIYMRNNDWLPLEHALTRDQTQNLGMCPDQEANLKPLDLQDVPTIWITQITAGTQFTFLKIHCTRGYLIWYNFLSSLLRYNFIKWFPIHNTILSQAKKRTGHLH